LNRVGGISVDVLDFENNINVGESGVEANELNDIVVPLGTSPKS